MNKKAILLLVFAPLVISSCSLMTLYSEDEFVTSSNSENPSNSSSSSENPPVEFSISSAAFVDKENHLEVNYTCNYASPFVVPDHPFKNLNITGITVDNNELDYSYPGYFTLLSPVVSTSLKFEFFDEDDALYISVRYNNVLPYEESSQTIDYPDGYDTLYWNDEFDGSSLDTSKWTYETGNGNWGWGNGEMEYYTNSNDTVSDGVLTISAKAQEMGGYHYTSTRIKTQNKVKFTYGYVEARIALPAEQAMWPAFWMMPNDDTYGGWPNSGEIDIMEARGRLPDRSSSAIHFSIPNDAGTASQHKYLTHEQDGSNIVQFHKYAVEWQADFIKFYIDDYCHASYNKTQWMTYNKQDSDTAPFDKDFYIILNLAVGGQFDNWVEPRSGFTSADRKVDYVRVFK